MARQSSPGHRARPTSKRGLLAAGVVGFGFSGLVDVLVLHHVLQWHHLLSGIYRTGTTAEGAA